MCGAHGLRVAPAPLIAAATLNADEKSDSDEDIQFISSDYSTRYSFVQKSEIYPSDDDE